MQLTTGDRLGSYEIQQELGSGGMGCVFRAADLRLKRDVALKVIEAANAGDRGTILRFQNEARACSALNHPHIVNVFDTGEENGVAYLVMELVSGTTLSQWVHQKQPKLEQIIDVLIQVADAVATAHDAGIIHRDLKPTNILVTEQGYAKVVDFGLAKIQSVTADATDTTAFRTTDGAILGTPSYMSPEQASGQAADARSDIFSLGTVLYESVAGQRAFGGQSFADVLHAVIHQEPPPLEVVAPGTPPALSWIVEKAMSKRPEERYLSAREFANDLKRLRTVIAAPERRTAATGAAERPPLRRSALWPWVAASVVALLLTAVVARQFIVSSRPLAPGNTFIAEDAVVRQLTSYGGHERSGAISPDGRYFAFIRHREGSSDIYVRQISGGDAVQITRDGLQKDDLVYSDDGNALYFTRFDDQGGSLASGAQGTAIFRIAALGGPVQRIMNGARYPSPRHGKLAFVRISTKSDNTLVGRQTIEIANIDGANPVEIYRGLGLGRIALSPDQTMIAFTEGTLFQPRNLQLVGTTPGSTKKRQITHYDRGWIYQQAWLPDGKHLLAARAYDPSWVSTASDLAIVSIDSGMSRRITMNLNSRFSDPTVSADGKRIVATSETFEREIWKVPITGSPEQNGDAAQLLIAKDASPAWIHAPWGSDKILVSSTATGSRNLWLAPINGSAPPRQLTFLEGNEMTHSSLSPDRTRIAYSVIEQDGVQIYVMNLEGSSARRLTSGPGYRYWPIWSPDGRFVAYSMTVVKGAAIVERDLVRIPAGGGPEQSVGRKAGFFRGDWSPDGRTIVGYRDSGDLQLLDVATGSYKVLAGGRWSWALPVWNRSGTKVAAARPESAISDALWILDVRTGDAKKAAVFHRPFHIVFRTPFTPDERAVIVNREQTVSNIVLLENF